MNDVSSQNQKYVLRTLGCKANLYDSQQIEIELQKRGWTPGQSLDDPGVSLCIVNSCTVTDEADHQSRKMAMKLARENPAAKIVITGCSAEVSPEALAESPGIHYVVGNRDKPNLVEQVLGALAQPRIQDKNSQEKAQILGVAEGYSEMLSRHPMDREWSDPESYFFTPPTELQSDARRTRVFLKVQDGCNSFCTYCVIPYGRGPSRSLRIPEVVKQIEELVHQGIKEVVITGINIGDYGIEWASEIGLTKPTDCLVQLFKEIFSKTSLERLRVSSLDPTEITPELIELMQKEPRFCPHFHVSLQSPHSRILRLMKRKYGWEDVKKCLESIAGIEGPRGGAFVGMDVITGFPGESDDEFEWSVRALEELPWSRLHVFPYSERSGTPATRLPSAVSKEKRSQRAKILRELSLRRLTGLYRKTFDFHKESNLPLESILVESPTRGPDGSYNWVAGYTQNYLRVILPAAEPTHWVNQLVRSKPTQILTDRIAGDLSFLGSEPKRI